MKLSVVIPCLNESQTLEKAIGLARGLVDGVGGDGEVVVADNGAGMSEETKKHIFEAFYQGDTSHKAEGNGLGLPLVRRIVDLHGGRVDVESALGRGTAFTVRLPDEVTLADR